jgi:hypothetical protein
VVAANSAARLVDRCEVLSETWEINVTAIKLRAIVGGIAFSHPVDLLLYSFSRSRRLQIPGLHSRRKTAQNMYKQAILDLGDIYSCSLVFPDVATSQMVPKICTQRMRDEKGH